MHRRISHQLKTFDVVVLFISFQWQTTCWSGSSRALLWRPFPWRISPSSGSSTTRPTWNAQLCFSSFLGLHGREACSFCLCVRLTKSAFWRFSWSMYVTLNWKLRNMLAYFHRSTFKNSQEWYNVTSMKQQWHGGCFWPYLFLRLRGGVTYRLFQKNGVVVCTKLARRVNKLIFPCVFRSSKVTDWPARPRSPPPVVKKRYASGHHELFHWRIHPIFWFWRSPGRCNWGPHWWNWADCRKWFFVSANIQSSGVESQYVCNLAFQHPCISLIQHASWNFKQEKMWSPKICFNAKKPQSKKLRQWMLWPLNLLNCFIYKCQFLKHIQVFPVHWFSFSWYFQIHHNTHQISSPSQAAPMEYKTIGWMVKFPVGFSPVCLPNGGECCNARFFFLHRYSRTTSIAAWSRRAAECFVVDCSLTSLDHHLTSFRIPLFTFCTGTLPNPFSSWIDLTLIHWPSQCFVVECSLTSLDHLTSFTFPLLYSALTLHSLLNSSWCIAVRGIACVCFALCYHATAIFAVVLLWRLIPPTKCIFVLLVCCLFTNRQGCLGDIGESFPWSSMVKQQQ